MKKKQSTEQTVRCVASGMSMLRTRFSAQCLNSFPGIPVMLTLLLLLAKLVYATAGSPWPIYRFDAGLSGRAQVEGPNIPDLFWEKAIGAEKIQSPVIAEDATIIFTSRGDQFVYALNPDGAEKWRFSHQNETFSFPPTLGNGGTIYVGSHESGFFAINPDGTLKWRAQVGGYVGNSANIDKNGNIYIPVDDGQLYVFSPSGTLLCIGSLDGLKPNNTPVIAQNGRVYVPAGNSIFVFDSSCRRIARWLLPSLDQVAWIANNAGGDILYAGSLTNPLVLALDAQTGNQIWSYSYNTSFGPPSQPALGPAGTIYFAGFNAGLLIALNPNGQEKWTFDLGSSRYKTMPVVDASGDIYIVNESTNFGLFKLSPNKEVLWQLPNVQCKYSPAFGPDGTIYVPSFKKLYAVRHQPPFAVSLQLVAGNSQVGCTDSALANPIQARVLDQYGNSFAGHPVRFRVILGTGQPVDVSVLTDNSGIAQVVWQLGSELGEQRLEVSSERSGQPLSGSSIIVSANAVGPQIGGANAIVFDPTAVNDSNQQTYIVRNLSACTLTITRLELNDDTQFAILTPVANAFVNPGGSLEVSLRFAPRSAGSHVATLSIFSNDPAAPQFDVTLSGEAFTQPFIVVDPDSLGFGQVRLNRTDSLQLTISNIGTADLVVTSFDFNDPAFSSSSSTPITIPVGGSVEVTVIFAPSEERDYAAELKIRSNDTQHNPVIVPLTGAGVNGPHLVVDPVPLVFGRVCTDSSLILPITISNIGSRLLVIDSFAISDSAFTIDADELSVLPGGSAKVLVAFSPKEVKVYTATLQIFSNDTSQSPFTVELQGEGIGPEIVLFARPPSLELCQGDSASLQTFIVNPSDCVLRVNPADVVYSFDFLQSSTVQNISLSDVLAFTEFIIQPHDTLALSPFNFNALPLNFNIRVSVKSNGRPNPATLTIPVKVLPPVIAAEDTVKFGDVLAGESKTDSAQVWAERCKVQIVSARITGTDAFAFSLESSFIFPVMLNEGDIANLPVTFHPKDEGIHVAILEVFSNDPQHNPIEIVLIGNGVKPAAHIKVEPNALAFGSVCDTTFLSTVITNFGERTLNVTGLVFTKPRFFTSRTTPFQVAPGASDTVWVGYAPILGQPASGDLLVLSDAANADTVVVALNGQGGAPDIAGTSTPLVFPNVDIRECANEQDSSSAVYTISNLGTCELVISSFIVDGAFSFVALPLPVVIPPQRNARVTLHFKPQTGGDFSGALHIFSNDPDTPQWTVPLNGKATATPKIAVEPDTLDFGKVLVGSSEDSTVIVRNEGGDTLRVTNIAINNPVFTTDAMPFNLTCKAPMAVDVTFTPNAVGPFVGTLTFTSNDTVKVVVLRGEGVAPMIGVDPLALPFGTVCDTICLPVTISNNGAVPLSITNLIFSNTAFFTLPPTNFTIPVAGKETILVCYAPQSGQPATGELQIVSNASNNAIVSVALSGQGGAPEIAGANEAVFDTVEVQNCAGIDNADTLVYVLRNTGTCTLTVQSFEIGGAFGVIAPTTPQFVAPGASLDITLGFTPQTNGAHGDTLVINNDDPDESRFEVALKGEGVFLPDIEVTPLELDFGPVQVNLSAKLPLTIANRGVSVLTVDKFTFSDSAFTIDTQEFSLACNKDSVVQIAFSPKAERAYVDTLRIWNNDPNENPVVVILRGNGAPPPPPDIDVSPVTYDFGTDCVVDSTLIEVRNVGEGLLHVTNLEFTNPAFWARPPLSFSVAANGAHEVTVLFKPSIAKTDNGNLLIHSNDPDEPIVVVNLKGTGDVPDIHGDSVAVFTPVEVQTCSGMDNKGAFIYKLFNTGNCTLTVRSFSVNAPFSVATAPFKIPPQGSSDVVLVFEPKANLTYTETLRVFSDDPDENPFEVELSGDGVFLPDIKVTPLTLNFGDVLVGKPDSLAITIANNGAVNLLVSSFVFSNPDFSSPTQPPFTLTCAQDSVVTIIFRPSRSGAYNETLTIGSNDLNENPVVVRLLGNGVTGGLVAGPNPLQFPDVCIGNDTTLCLTVVNTGTVGLAVVNWSVSPNDGVFRLDTPVSEFFLGVGQQNSTNICVTFIPPDTLEHHGTLTIFTDPVTGPTVVQLIGRGVSPQISGTRLLAFPATGVGSNSVLPDTVFNKTMCDLRLDSLAITGADSINFSIVGITISPDTTIAGNDSLKFFVKFEPKSVGQKTAQLKIWSNDQSRTASPFFVQLQGNAPTGSLYVSQIIPFGDVCLHTAVTAVCSLKNIGRSPLEVGKIDFIGSDESAFDLEKPLPLGALLPNEVKTFKVIFTPIRPATFENMVRVIAKLEESKTQEEQRKVSGTGLDDVPVLRVTREFIDFGQVFLDAKKQELLTLVNLGCDTLVLSSFNPVIDKNAFIVSAPPTPVFLPRNASITILVQFNGYDFGMFKDAFTVTNTDPKQRNKRIDLQGEVKDGDICVRPEIEKLNFGQVLVNKEKPLQLGLTNCTPGTRIRIKAYPEKRSEYSVLPKELPIFMGASQFITVVFKPVVAGVFPDSLVLEKSRFDDSTKIEIQKVALVGEGVGEPKVEANPNAFTPNEDGANDEAKIVFPGEKLVRPALHIFDMRGLRVRYFNEPNHNDHTFAWNGRSENGEMQLPGSYLWILEDQGKKIGSGQIVLIR